MNKSVFFFVLSFLIGSYSVSAQKSTRIAYVDMQYILDHMDEYKVASEQLSQKVAQWEKEIKEKQGEITQRKEKLAAEKPLLTPEMVKDREEEIQVLEGQLEDYRQKRFGASTGDYITQRWKLVQPIQDQVFNIAQEIGKTKKFDYIFTAEDAASIYADEKNDITKIVLRLLKRKDHSEDRNKEISTLLKENLNFEYKDEKQRKAEERQKQYESNLAKRQQEREQLKKKRQEELEKRQRERAELQEKKKAEKANQTNKK
jgi:hypothetical protein